MDRRAFLLALPAGLAGAARAARPALAPVTDLQADGERSRARRVPIVVLFSLPGCPYCEAVRREHLLPLQADPVQGARMILRQVDIDSDLAVKGFSGERTTHAALAAAQGIRAVPVVAFWDGRGRAVADPLKGMLLPDFYGAYLSSALDEARARIAAGA